MPEPEDAVGGGATMYAPPMAVYALAPSMSMYTPPMGARARNALPKDAPSMYMPPMNALPKDALERSVFWGNVPAIAAE